MQLTSVQERVSRLERALSDSSPSPGECIDPGDLPALMQQLLALAQDAVRIEKRSVARGDDGVALAAMREACRIVELIARVRGHADNTSTNILNVNIDPNTARRIAEIYIKRNRTIEQEETCKPKTS